MHFIRTKLSLGLILVLLILLTLSVGLAHAQDDNTLRILSLADIRTSDPHVAYEVETWPTAALFYTGLVRWADDNSEIVPALAESYSISDDGLVYTFTLREGIKFSNGRDITPEDVKWSFERMFYPETTSPTAYMFEAIVGASAILDGTATEADGITVVDDRTVEFTLEKPVWSLIQRFALPPGFIVAKEGVEAAGDQFGFQPLGAGPFMLESWESGISITGTRNPYYYIEGRPSFDRFEMQLGIEPSTGILKIEAGEADVALDFVPNSDYPRIAADPALAERLLTLIGFPNIDYVVFNHTRPPFDNVDVRKAMAMAVDRDRLVQIFNGRAIPAAGPIPPTVLGDNADLQPPAYDPEGAKELLASAGYPDGLTIKYLTNTFPSDLSFAQALASDWAAIGVNAEITSIDNAQFLDVLINQPDEFDIAQTSWWMDYPDPSNIWEPLAQCGGSYNWGKFCSETLDAAFEAANSIPPGDERWAAFSDFEAQILEEMPHVYLTHQLYYYFTSERIELEADPAILFRWDKASVK